MGLLVPRHRRSDPEWMDREGNRVDELSRCLRDLRTINRLLGGRSALRHALRPHILATPPGRRLSVLDVGTGDGDLPRAIATDARRLGRRADIVAIDRDPVVADLARAACDHEPGIRLVRADGFGLPFEDDAFDIVTASMFLHHFSEEDAISLLLEFRRVARGTIVINDLRRHRVPWAFVWLLGRLHVLSPMSAHDGPLSVLKGFTQDELEAIGRVVGGDTPPGTQRLWPFRLLLEIPSS